MHTWFHMCSCTVNTHVCSDIHVFIHICACPDPWVSTWLMVCFPVCPEKRATSQWSPKPSCLQLLQDIHCTVLSTFSCAYDPCCVLKDLKSSIGSKQCSWFHRVPRLEPPISFGKTFSSHQLAFLPWLDMKVKI